MKSRLRVLTYHRVAEHDDEAVYDPALVSATPESFARQMQHLAERYRVVSLPEVLEAQRRRRRLPERAVLITFDDAYRDFRDVVWPVLKGFGLPATLFIPTAFPGQPGGSYWWDRLHGALASTPRDRLILRPLGSIDLDTPGARWAAYRRLGSFLKTVPHDEAMALVERICGELEAPAAPPPRVLSWDALRELDREGVSLAAHSRNHPVLTRLPSRLVREEVSGSLADLSREIGSVLPVFCYPTGAHDARVVRAVADAGVELAFTCLEGHNSLPSGDPLRLRRTSISRRTTPAIFRLRLRRLVSWVDMWRRNPARRAIRSPYTAPDGGDRRGRSRVAYIMSRFPKLSETFVLNEIVALDALGVRVEVYPLLRERQDVTHPEVAEWVRRARFHPFVSLPILRAQLHFVRRNPIAYFRLVAEVLRKTWGSPNFFIGALGILPKAVRFAYEMERLGVRHVHAHFATHPAVAALVVHRLTGIPFSFTAHGSDLHVDRRMLDTKVEAAEFAVTVSCFNEDVIVETCGEHLRRKIHVIHCGVDTDLFCPPPPRRNGARPFQLACVASLEEVKGHRFLIDACRILHERGLDLRCHLVGDGPLRRDIEDRIARVGLGDRILMHGARPRPEVARLLSEVDAAVLASHPTREGKREGIPVALMEAMSSGLPVVASAISGIPELVETGRTGFLVPSGDPRALADALERLGRDPVLRERMGSAARERVVRSFDLRANTLRLLRLFGAEPPREAPRAAGAGSLTTGVGSAI